MNGPKVVTDRPHFQYSSHCLVDAPNLYLYLYPWLTFSPRPPPEATPRTLRSSWQHSSTKTAQCVNLSASTRPGQCGKQSVTPVAPHVRVKDHATGPVSIAQSKQLWQTVRGRGAVRG
jgi:hypothetical protein